MVTTIKAYAKINLALNVYDKLDNGYHNIDMVTIPLELHDTLELDKLPKDYETYITSNDMDLPTDQSNLSSIAFNKFKDKVNFSQNYLIHIYKRIPMRAGLGGGSADAAAVINGVIKSLKLQVKDEDLIEVAKSIGGDVSFCLYNKPTRCRGIGEKLEFINMKKQYHVLLVKPLEGVSTKNCYDDFDLLEHKPEKSNIERLIQGLEEGNDQIVKEEMKNVLQPCAINLVPKIKEIIDTLKNDGFDMVMMSGSGSTVFALSNNQKDLMKEMKKFNSDNYITILTKTL